VVPLEKAPKIAVYTPDQALPWDDAVTLALTYAEVEYDKIWDVEVLEGKLMSMTGYTSTTRILQGSMGNSGPAIKVCHGTLLR
jgi:hypothetical protein